MTSLLTEGDAMRRILASAILVFNLGPIDGMAQEGLSPEEIIRFLPNAEYTNLEHYDLSQAQGEPAWPLFHHFFQTRNALLGNRNPMGNPLPEEYHGREESLTSARFQATTTKELFMTPPAEGKNLRTKAAKFVDGPVQSVRPVGEPDADGTQRYEVAIAGGDILTVIRSAEAEQILADATDKGYLEQTGQLPDGQPIYRFESKDWRDQKVTLHALQAATGEILVAERIESLRQMLKAAAGETSILDHPDRSELIAVLSDLGRYPDGIE
jgi:hypothetical protein